ncbi:MAG: hypothetical protein ACI8SZ_002275, partial [Colwellia sp.]
FKLFPGMKVYLAKESAQEATQAVAADVSAQ